MPPPPPQQLLQQQQQQWQQQQWQPQPHPQMGGSFGQGLADITRHVIDTLFEPSSVDSGAWQILPPAATS